MTKTWEIDVGAQQFDLTDGKGHINVSVRNVSSDPRTAVLDLVVAPEIAPWFTIDKPLQEVPPGATTIYKVSVSIPPNTDPGEHAVIPRVYTANEAPEETSEMGGRVLLTVPAPAPAPAPRPRFKLWWLVIAIAVILVAVITTVAVIATRPDEDDTSTTPQDPPVTEPATTVVPDLTGLSEDDAMAALAQTLLVPTIKHRHDPATTGTVTQTLPPGIEVEAGTPIEVVFHVNLSAPTPITAINAGMPRADRQILLESSLGEARRGDVASQVDLAWTQNERYVTSWQVQIDTFICFISDDPLVPTNVLTITTVWTTVTTPSFSTIRYNALGTFVNDYSSAVITGYSPYPKLVHTCGERWSVGAVDDFGNVGPMSPSRSYQLAQ